MVESEIEVGVRILSSGARPPRAMTGGASGFDLESSSEVTIDPGRVGLVPTGLAIAIPDGYEGQVRPRSGLALRHAIGVLNAPGTIDSDYRGELRIILANFGTEPFRVQPGDRVAQLVLQRVVRARFVVREALDDTERGAGGFGHTGGTPAL